MEKQENTIGQKYDHIVIGAGSAGCILTRRLLDAGKKVLLIEAGPIDNKPEIHDPMGSIALWNSDVDWAFETEPQKFANNRRLPFPRGKTLGGSSSFNGMIYVRGAKQDFDTWAYLGNHGWDYESVKNNFKRFEQFIPEEDAINKDELGTKGDLPITLNPQPTDITKAFIADAIDLGIPYNPNYNDGNEMFGAYHTWLTLKDNKRMSSWVAFLEPLKNHPNLTVLVNANVTRVVFSGETAVGVAYTIDSSEYEEQAYAKDDIILSAGSINTPKILMLSGIGDQEHLKEVGISSKVHLPGVGQNLQDHINVPHVWETHENIPLSKAQGLEGTFFWKTKPDMKVPDMQPILITFPYPMEKSPENGFTIVSTLLHPQSRGIIKLKSNNPNDKPIIDPRFLEDPDDLNALVLQTLFLRKLVTGKQMGSLIKKEFSPGAEVDSIEDLENFIKAHAVSDHHQVGTAKMGVDKMAVVDPRLKVYGVKNLRVADGSIMPMINTGNTNAACIMIGDRAADFILNSEI
ncbi:GMC family oxidoreductase [Chryseobacterium sp. PTM-20240506]|uniref:GMC family oxidoreductase n=1 Tax=Chryseobacterium sp. PTM-20240506 TaxID=3400631 RepID=UPI003AAB774B